MGMMIVDGILKVMKCKTRCTNPHSTFGGLYVLGEISLLQWLEGL